LVVLLYSSCPRTFPRLSETYQLYRLAMLFLHPRLVFNDSSLFCLSSHHPTTNPIPTKLIEPTAPVTLTRPVKSVKPLYVYHFCGEKYPRFCFDSN
jgi:hypothetical protein